MFVDLIVMVGTTFRISLTIIRIFTIIALVVDAILVELAN